MQINLTFMHVLNIYRRSVDTDRDAWEEPPKISCRDDLGNP